MDAGICDHSRYNGRFVDECEGRKVWDSQFRLPDIKITSGIVTFVFTEALSSLKALNKLECFKVTR